jgi:hypothetical protein
MTSSFLNLTIVRVLEPPPGHSHRTEGSWPRSAILYTVGRLQLKIFFTSLAVSRFSKFGDLSILKKNSQGLN